MIPKTKTKTQPTRAEVMAQADERRALMTARRAQGATYRVIGQEFGISTSRVRQIIEVDQSRRLLKNQEPNRVSLPSRVRLALSYSIEEPEDEDRRSATSSSPAGWPRTPSEIFTAA
ncbi:sigma factor-like helix-turn-helix DNA-binding protein [Sphingomonas sp. PAMC 26605]|uniref:sigma factor-like helix-turn-helix DNA-binding protein n=1 Tax=Sphingomonas sp. PAMC 26605 TaxID=1112214 RepID=UPI00026CDE5C|nr:sigma factor-like helix-turn-helix DNA-binding protein [Sphingomonas sp. PAMC 26605]